MSGETEIGIEVFERMLDNRVKKLSLEYSDKIVAELVRMSSVQDVVEWNEISFLISDFFGKCFAEIVNFYKMQENSQNKGEIERLLTEEFREDLIGKNSSAMLKKVMSYYQKEENFVNPKEVADKLYGAAFDVLFEMVKTPLRMAGHTVN